MARPTARPRHPPHTRQRRQQRRACPRTLLTVVTLALALAGCASLPPGSIDTAAAAVSGTQYVIVAVADAPGARATAGAAVRGGYGLGAGYAASANALADAAGVAASHGLVQVKAWTIQALNWRCMLYRLPEGIAQDAALRRLAADARVRLAQPLNDYETLATPAVTKPRSGYNDPYLALQTGFAAIDAAGAQRQTRGEGVTVAVIDTYVDVNHPELQGRIDGTRDFVGRPSAGEAHGTEVAGIIAAAANNGVGIAGVAPAARLLALRSCWAPGAGLPGRCNSFTLAQGLAAALAAGADVINLSLAGPADPLLEALARQAIARGTVIVAALPASGRREGFPSAVPGVLAVAASEGGVPPDGVLTAPGRQVLTLTTGGGYDYADGSSMASAHVSGVAALLRSRDRQLDSARLALLLPGLPGQPVDACRALLRVSPRLPAAECGATPAGPPPPGPSAAGWPAPAPGRP